MEAKARLFLNQDKTKLVAEGHEEAAFLYAAPGDEIPEDAAKQFCLVDGDLPKRKAATDTTSKTPPARKPKAAPANKGGAAPANKGGAAPENKGGAAPANKDAAATTEQAAKDAAVNEDQAKLEAGGDL